MINFGGTVNRVEDAKLEFVFTNNTGDVILTGDSIAMGGLVWDNSTSVDGQFTIGGAVTGKLTINLFNEGDALSIYDFRDSYLTAYLKMEGASNYTVMGQYFVGEFRYDGAMIALTAYDMMSKFDRPTSYLGNPAPTLTWPMPLKTMIQTACSICGVTLRDSTNPTPWDSYSITQKPQQWDSMTWHDVIAACAQISGTFAKIDAYGRLYFDWYDTSILSGTNEWDGGTFTGEAIPYADGDDLDGGTFDPWNTGDAADGGTFGDRANVHVIPSAYSLTVDTDDVVITGLKVTLEASDNIVQGEGTQTHTVLEGTEGYVITISGNPLIETSANADAVAVYLGNRVIGMMFRPLNASLIEDPTIEAGDVALIEGTNGNTYSCFISHVTYTTNAATIISCDAESTGISSKVRFSMSDKIRNETEQIQRDVQAVKTISDITNQYFWFAESGVSQDVGTGAHITQIPQDDFIADPEHGGGNLLARSNGIALREGVHELTTLTQGGMEINSFDSDGNAVNIAHLGYGEGVAPSGNAYTPFFTFGTRKSGDAIGNYSVAEGLDVTASRPYSHAEGYHSAANANYSHAEGVFSEAVYSFIGASHAEGYYGRAEGAASHAEGYHSTAGGAYSHAQNEYTIASSRAQTTLGKYNVEDSADTYAVIVGNGTGPSTGDRANALTVDWNGAVSVADKTGTQHGIGIDCGNFGDSFSLPANSYVDKTVTFSAVFTSPPIVVATIECASGNTNANTGNVCCAVVSRSTTTATIRIFNNATSKFINGHWIAIGS